MSKQAAGPSLMGDFFLFVLLFVSVFPSLCPARARGRRVKRNADEWRWHRSRHSATHMEVKLITWKFFSWMDSKQDVFKVSLRGRQIRLPLLDVTQETTEIGAIFLERQQLSVTCSIYSLPIPTSWMKKAQTTCHCWCCHSNCICINI